MANHMSEYESMRTADIVAEALIDWKVEFIFGLPGYGINGFIEVVLRKRQDKITLYLLDMKCLQCLQHLWHVLMPNIQGIRACVWQHQDKVQ
jgi:hypothetical protein